VHTETLSYLEQKLARWAESRGASVGNEAILRAEELIGVSFSEDYKSFLRRYGSAMVGPLPIYGLSAAEALGDNWSVIERTQRFREGQWHGCDEWAVISMDQSGNPIGLDGSGVVWTYDHDTGETIKLADTFEGLIRKSCLKL
jgi:hypothetical protein